MTRSNSGGVISEVAELPEEDFSDAEDLEDAADEALSADAAPINPAEAPEEDALSEDVQQEADPEKLSEEVIIDLDHDSDEDISVPDGIDEVLEEQDAALADGEEDYYTVTYHPNGGYWFEWVNDAETLKREFVREDEIYVDEEEEISFWTRGDFYSEHAILAGWSENPEADEPDYAQWTKHTIESDLDLYAVWTPAYNITFDGGSGAECNVPMFDPIAGEEAKGKQTLTIQMKPEAYVSLDSYSDYFAKDGERITKWIDEDRKEFDRSKGFFPKEDVTLTADWGTAYALTLDPNGGEYWSYQNFESTRDPFTYSFVDGETFRIGSPYVYRDGYELTGWSWDKAGKNLLISNDYDEDEEDENTIPYETKLTKEDSGKTLYAVWTKTLSITVNYNGGKDEDGDTDFTTSVRAGKEYHLWSEGIIPPAGKALKGLKDDKGNLYPNEDGYVTVPAPYDGMVLTAQWVAGVAVTYHADTIPGGLIDNDADEDATAAHTVYYETGKSFYPNAEVYNSEDAENSHYWLKGWSLNKNGSGTLYGGDDGDLLTVTRATDLYAVWQKYYIVCYDPNNGSSDEEDTWGDRLYDGDTLYRDYSYMEGPNERSVFLGWSEDADAVEPEYTNENEGSASRDMTLYAVWSAEEGKLITYHANGGYFGWDEERLETKTSAVTTGQPFYQASYVEVEIDSKELAFAGWSTSEDGEEQIDEDMLITEDLDLYAIWKPAANITFDPNGGQFVWEDGWKNSEPYNHKIVKGYSIGWTPNAQRSGYTFLGWSVKQNDTANVITIDWDHPYEAAADATLYAVWKVNAPAPAKAAPAATVAAPATPAEQITIAKKPASIKAKAAKKGKVTVSWKKFKATSKKNKAIWKKVKKIEVQYSTDSSFQTGVVTKMLGKKKTKLVVKKLTANTTYYFRVRYIESTGKVSAWSGVKRVKAKK